MLKEVLPEAISAFKYRKIKLPASMEYHVIQAIKIISVTDSCYKHTIDGQKLIPMDVQDQFEVEIFSKSLKIIGAKNMNYFKLLNEKLNWGL